MSGQLFVGALAIMSGLYLYRRSYVKGEETMYGDKLTKSHIAALSTISPERKITAPDATKYAMRANIHKIDARPREYHPIISKPKPLH